MIRIVPTNNGHDVAIKIDKHITVISLSADDPATPDCPHQCSGNCRRNGCNCACGEWHKLDE